MSDSEGSIINVEGFASEDPSPALSRSRCSSSSGSIRSSSASPPRPRSRPRIKRIEGLENLIKIEVLDLYGNQIVHVNGLSNLNQSKVLNLAGNQIRNIGASDLKGLVSLQEFDLRRNRLKKLLGFGETPSLQKLFLSNNELQILEDMCSLAKATNVREIAVDNNPISLEGDCISFLVSYLPHLIILNGMQITDQVRKAAMAWRRNKESPNAAFMDLTSDVCLNVRREEVISNARTNWELLRSQSKCLAAETSNVVNVLKNLKPVCDFILTSLAKPEFKNNISRPKPRMISNTTKVPILPDKKLNIVRTPSQDTENSQNTSSSNASSSEIFRLPPILVPIINKLEQKNDSCTSKEDSIKLSGSLSSIGPNVDSSVRSLLSHSESNDSNSESNESSSDTEEEEKVPIESEDCTAKAATLRNRNPPVTTLNDELKITSSALIPATETSSNISTATSASNPTAPSSTSESDISNPGSFKNSRSIKSAATARISHSRVRSRPVTAKPKKEPSPIDQPAEKYCEQGVDSVPASALDAANFLLFIDQLFDSVNGSVIEAQHGKRLRCAVTASSPHIQFWNGAIQVLQSIKFFSKTRKEYVPPTIKNWLSTLNGLNYLWTKLHGKGGLTFLCPRGLNQDPVENFFTSIRSHGARNINPTCIAFTASFKSLVVNNFMSSYLPGSNCEDDECEGARDNLKTFLVSQEVEADAVHLVIPTVNPVTIVGEMWGQWHNFLQAVL